jgi:hypothetical protein
MFNEDSELYFDVWERPCFFVGSLDSDNVIYYEDKDHKHIVRIINDKPISLGVVGINYKLLKNRELHKAAEDVFVEELTSDELKDVYTTDQISYLGGVCIRNYIFPEIKANIGSERSNIAFRVILINGYDGTSSVKIYHGAIDFFCTNGMVSGSHNMILKRHTSGLDTSYLTAEIRKCIGNFHDNAEKWRQWVIQPVRLFQVQECYEAIPGISKQRVKQLFDRYLYETTDHGHTVWAMYSAATFYASNGDGNFAVKDTGKDHSAISLFNREEQIRSWTTTPEFMALLP